MPGYEGFGFVLPHWFYWLWLAVMPLLVFALLYWKHREALTEATGVGTDEAALEMLAKEDPTERATGNLFTRGIDWISNASGLFVALWTVNAVVAYFYEVIMRYLFNMPTIWVHEASYLLFGMQYLLAGAFAFLHGSHVRVDIVYAMLPPRQRISLDIFTSVFFFIFALALIGTSWRFFMDSYSMGETTMETWGIQHWPVKGMMLLGAVLIALAGISKLIKDIQLFRRLGKQ